MVICSAINCSRSSKKLSTAESKGWHRIPSDSALRKKWIIAMKRVPPYPQERNFVLCGHHFTEDDSGSNRKYELNKDAIPSIFYFTADKKEKK